MKKWLRLGVMLGLCASAGWAVDWRTLQPHQFISDSAGVIDAPTPSQLLTYFTAIHRPQWVSTVLPAVDRLGK